MSHVVFANPQLQRFASATRPRPLWRFAYGVFLEVVAWLTAPLMWGLAAIPSIFAGGLAGALTRVPGGVLFGMLVLTLYLFLFMPAWILLMVRVVRRIRRQGRRHRLDCRARLSWDRRAPLLYLRSFYDDYEEDPNRRDLKTPEEILTQAIEGAGPIVTVGRPQEKLPLLGAARIYLPEESWQESVRHLMRAAQLVVIHADVSRGLLWEMEAAKELVRPERLLISLLAWKHQDGETRQRLYETFQRNAEAFLPGRLPPRVGRASFIVFGPGGEPRPIAVSRWKRLLLCGMFIPAVRESLRPHLRRAGVRLGFRHPVIYLFNAALLAWLTYVLAGLPSDVARLDTSRWGLIEYLLNPLALFIIFAAQLYFFILTLNALLRLLTYAAHRLWLRYAAAPAE